MTTDSLSRLTYRGCDFRETTTTTDVRRQAFAHGYTAIAHVWGISGRMTKSAMVRPFLTSATECREYVRSQDFLAETSTNQGENENGT
jgi:hypothetical protein